MAIQTKYGRVMTEEETHSELLMLASIRRKLRIEEAKMYGYLMYKELVEDYEAYSNAQDDLIDTVICHGSEDDVDYLYEIVGDGDTTTKDDDDDDDKDEDDDDPSYGGFAYSYYLSKDDYEDDDEGHLDPTEDDYTPESTSRVIVSPAVRHELEMGIHDIDDYRPDPNNK